MNDSNHNGGEILRIYGVVLSVGICCSLAIVTTYEVTRPIIRRNQEELRRSAILEVLPRASTIKAFCYDEDSRGFVVCSRDGESRGQSETPAELVFAGFDSGGELVGLALETKGMGYQDNIRTLYAYSLDKQAIVGVRVLESRETPGLGDRIETDENFLQNFVQLDVALSPAGDGVANPIEYVKPGTKVAAWQVDGITGATISSRAIADMLGRSTAEWIPRLYRPAMIFSCRMGRDDCGFGSRSGQHVERR